MHEIGGICYLWRSRFIIYSRWKFRIVLNCSYYSYIATLQVDQAPLSWSTSGNQSSITTTVIHKPEMLER